MIKRGPYLSPAQPQSVKEIDLFAQDAGMRVELEVVEPEQIV